CQDQSQARNVSRRMELFYPAISGLELFMLFMRSALVGASNQKRLADHRLDLNRSVGGNFAAVLRASDFIHYALAQGTADLPQPPFGDRHTHLRGAPQQLTQADVARSLLAEEKAGKQINDRAKHQAARQA